MEGHSFSRSQLDRLGDELKKGDTSADAITMLSTYRDTFMLRTSGLVRELVPLIDCAYALTSRPAKSTNSIIAKLNRESTRLSQIQDISGVRIIVKKVSQQDRLVDRIKRRFPGAKVFDRRSNEKGYRAVHVVVRYDGLPIEIQVRTGAQDAWAQLSEKLADKHGFDLKYGGGPEHVAQLLEKLSGIVSDDDRLRDVLDDLRSKLVRLKKLPERSSDAAELEGTYKELQALGRRMRTLTRKLMKSIEVT